MNNLINKILLVAAYFVRCVCVGTVAVSFAIGKIALALAHVCRWAIIAAIGLLALPFILAGLACVVVVLVLAIPFALIL